MIILNSFSWFKKNSQTLRGPPVTFYGPPRGPMDHRLRIPGLDQRRPAKAVKTDRVITFIQINKLFYDYFYTHEIEKHCIQQDRYYKTILNLILPYSSYTQIAIKIILDLLSVVIVGHHCATHTQHKHFSHNIMYICFCTCTKQYHIPPYIHIVFPDS